MRNELNLGSFGVLCTLLLFYVLFHLTPITQWLDRVLAS